MKKWQHLGLLDIAGGKVSISDTSYFYDEPLIVDLPTGLYRVLIDWARSDDETYIRAMRIVADRGEQKVFRGAFVGTVLIDFGQIGVCCRESMERAFAELGDSGMSAYYRQLDTTDPYGIVSLPRGGTMIIARPAFGDGLYRTYELIGEGKREGIEIDFSLCLEPEQER